MAFSANATDSAGVDGNRRLASAIRTIVTSAAWRARLLYPQNQDRLSQVAHRFSGA
jgi:hypothetical protein